tara:strand:+ start:1208 stop:2446 length:1239 start_codon:yes stop_codon:yes gene_type:complete
MGNNITKILKDDEGALVRTGGQWKRNGNGNRDPENITKKESIDLVAAHYILTMSKESFESMQDSSDCEEIRWLTTESLGEFGKNAGKNEIIDYYNRITGNSKKTYSKNMCMTISNFILDIAKIFSSIVKTIQPKFKYIDTDEDEKPVVKIVKEKSDIPFDKEFSVSKFSFCGSRINALKLNSTEKEDICIAEANTLEDVFGIPELTDLYFDEGWNPDLNAFTGMNEDTKKKYEEHLSLFWCRFSGKEIGEKPDHIQKFGDIPLNSYQDSKFCSNTEENSDTSFIDVESGTKEVNDDNLKNLLILYADNWKHMIQKTVDKQERLRRIINSLFIYTDVGNGEKLPMINPNLDETSIKLIKSESRELLTTLFLECELDFLKGMKIYDAISDKLIYDTTLEQLREMDNICYLLKTK